MELINHPVKIKQKANLLARINLISFFPYKSHQAMFTSSVHGCVGVSEEQCYKKDLNYKFLPYIMIHFVYDLSKENFSLTLFQHKDTPFYTVQYLRLSGLSTPALEYNHSSL